MAKFVVICGVAFNPDHVVSVIPFGDDNAKTRISVSELYNGYSNKYTVAKPFEEVLALLNDQND